jgi:Ca-activated chloride channel homolog
MNKISIALILILSIPLIHFSPAAQNQKNVEDQPTISVNVDLVTTDVTVTGNEGMELQANDFVIYDNNIAQQISYFSRDQLPLDIAIAIDCTGSITGYLQMLKIAGLSALRHLRPEDQVAFFSFASQSHRLSELTGDRLSLAKGISNLGFINENGTNIYGALYDVARYMKKEAPRGRRRGILAITDNCHNAGMMDARMSEVELLESNTALYDLVTVNSRETIMDSCRNANSMIRQIAQTTGGGVIEIEGFSSIKNALDQAISKLRMQCVLGFNPSDPGAPKSFHTLKVQFANKNRCPKCQITARRGYYHAVRSLPAPPSQASQPPMLSSSQISQELMRQSIIVAGTSLIDLNEISFKLANANQLMDDDGQSEIQLDLVIDSNNLYFTKRENTYSYSLILTSCYFQHNGKSLGSDSWMFNRSLSETEYDAAMTKGIQLSIAIPLKMPNQTTKIVIYDEKNDQIGSRFLVRKGKSYVIDYRPPP